MTLHSRSTLITMPLLVTLALQASPSWAQEASGDLWAGPFDPIRVLSDEDVLQYASAPFDQATLQFHRITLGRHRGVPVVADFPCSDECPDDTVLVLAYDIDITLCDTVGGRIKRIRVPRGIGAGEESFCVPPVLVTPADSSQQDIQLDPVTVVEALFTAARTRDFSVLGGLCDPTGHDGDTEAICAVGAAGADPTQFVEYFQDGRVNQPITAEVAILFGPGGTREESMRLSRVDGRWYLSSY
jgi:hypothetical protein